MMRPKRVLSALGGKLYTPYLVVVLLMTVLMCVILYIQTRDAVNVNMIAAMTAGLNQTAVQLERRMDEMEQITQIVWINPQFQAMMPSIDTEKINNSKDILTYYRLLDAFEDIRKVNREYYIRIYMNDNTLFADEGKLFFPMSVISDQLWFDDTQQTSARAFWRIFRSDDAQHTLSVVRSSAWSDPMGVRAVICVGFPKIHLDDSLLNPFVESGGHTLLLTSDGQVLSGIADGTDAYNHLPDTVLSIIRSGASSATWNDQPYLLAHKMLGRADLELVSLVPPTSGWDAMRSGLVGTLAMLSAFLVILVGVAVIFTNRYHRRINNLVKHIETIEGDGFTKRIKVVDAGEIAVIERKFNDMSLRLRNMMDEIHESDRRKRKAEISALQSQMNPHFLYNTLDAINWMAIDAHQYDIAETLATLGTFFRMVLSGDKAIITVKDELVLTEQYIKIQQLRNQKNLAVTFDISPECMPYLCVKLLIQPLIENAIKHSDNANGMIVIRIEMTLTPKGYLQLSVLDNGIGIVAAAELPETRKRYRSGYGLKSVEQRLMLHFGEDIMMSLGDGLEGKGTCVTLVWPARLADDNNTND